MVIVNIIGGLGNQMFQYAVGTALAIQSKQEVKLDITAFQNYELRDYELNVFTIDSKIASKEEIDHVKQNELDFREKYFHFDPGVLDLDRSVYLSGYWQSEKYFIAYKDFIRQAFTLKNKLSQQSSQFQKLIDSTISVSLHIRRGDYVTNPETNDFHGTCSPDYYKNAISLISNKILNPHFFIFSDDLDWAKENLDFIDQMTFIELDKNIHDSEEMYLMSQCKHNIIANSSFSWWGAWLNQNPEKIVIAPKKWFIAESMNTTDLIPNSWIRLGDESSKKNNQVPELLTKERTNEEIMVSVCVMSYNLEKYISKALESILMQKVNFQYNIVIGDDFSTDNTRQILQKYTTKYPHKFKLLLHESNLGILANFAETLKACNGKYLALLDGDDYWTDPLKLQKQVDFMESHKDYSMVFHNTELHDHTKHGIVITPFNLGKHSREYTADEILETWSVTTCSVLCINKEQYRYIENNLWFPVQDLPFFLCCASMGKIYYLSETMCVYRRLPTGSQYSKEFRSVKIHLDFIKYFQVLYNDFSNLLSKKAIERASAFNYLIAARKSKSNGDQKGYLQYLALAMAEDFELIYEKEIQTAQKNLEDKINQQQKTINNREITIKGKEFLINKLHAQLDENKIFFSLCKNFIEISILKNPIQKFKAYTNTKKSHNLQKRSNNETT